MKIFYKAGYKYQITQNYVIKTDIYPKTNIETDYIDLNISGVLLIKKGYSFDGASGAKDTKTIMRGALVHDALYQLLRMEKIEPKYKKEADKLLYKCCIEDGMWKLRAKWVYAAVKKFGKSSTLAENQKKVHYAP